MGFKKCTSLILAILLLVCNTGFALTIHFCEGKIASISSTYSDEEVCDMPVEKQAGSCCAKVDADHKDCCSNNIIDLQDNTDDVVVKAFSFQFDSPYIIESWKPITFSVIDVGSDTSQVSYYCDANAPPLFKLFNQYIFYA